MKDVFEKEDILEKQSRSNINLKSVNELSEMLDTDE